MSVLRSGQSPLATIDWLKSLPPVGRTRTAIIYPIPVR